MAIRTLGTLLPHSRHCYNSYWLRGFNKILLFVYKSSLYGSECNLGFKRVNTVIYKQKFEQTLPF